MGPPLPQDTPTVGAGDGGLGGGVVGGGGGVLLDEGFVDEGGDILAHNVESGSGALVGDMFGWLPDSVLAWSKLDGIEHAGASSRLR